LVPARSRPVGRRRQLGAQHATEAGLFLYFAAGTGRVLLITSPLALGERPILVPGPVDDQHLATTVLAQTVHDPASRPNERLHPNAAFRRRGIEYRRDSSACP